MFAIPNVEKEFFHAQHQTQLQGLAARMQRIEQLVGARQSSFAGVLPSVMAARQIRHDAPERVVTVAAVEAAVEQLIEKLRLPLYLRIIVLGGAGFIGAPVVEHLKALGHQVVVVDPQASTTWPQEWEGSPTILLNISRKNAIYQYIEKTWSSMILLNEVYPAPSAKAIRLLEQRGVKSFHIVGVAGRAWPSFPDSYEGAIPCCAGQAHLTPQVIVRRLDNLSFTA